MYYIKKKLSHNKYTMYKYTSYYKFRPITEISFRAVNYLTIIVITFKICINTLKLNASKVKVLSGNVCQLLLTATKDLRLIN